MTANQAELAEGRAFIADARHALGCFQTAVSEVLLSLSGPTGRANEIARAL